MSQTPDRNDVIRLFGPVSDHTIVEILKLGAGFDVLEVAAMHLAQEDDVMGEAGKPLNDAAAQIIGALMKDELFAEGDERGDRSPPS